jgi:hypothetical protein
MTTITTGTAADAAATKLQAICPSAKIVRMNSDHGQTAVLAVWAAPGNPQYARKPNPIYAGVVFSAADIRHADCVEAKISDFTAGCRAEGFDYRTGAWRKRKPQ